MDKALEADVRATLAALSKLGSAYASRQMLPTTSEQLGAAAGVLQDELARAAASLKPEAICRTLAEISDDASGIRSDRGSCVICRETRHATGCPWRRARDWAETAR